MVYVSAIYFLPLFRIIPLVTTVITPDANPLTINKIN